MGKLGAVGGLVRRSQRQHSNTLETKIFQQYFSVDAYNGSSASDEKSASDEGFSGKMELWTWGKGEIGQLGLGDEGTQRSPCCVKSLSLPSSTTLAPVEGVLRRAAPAFESKVQRVENNSCILQSVKGKEMGGNDQHESVASGSKPSVRSIHVSQPGMDEGVGITCGLFHSGLWADGHLWLWGKGAGGRLGIGSEEPRYSPTHVSGLRDVTNVALGGLHSASIANGGSLYTWGFGGFGSLGHGNYSRQMLPKKLTGEEWMENVKRVAAGGSHTAAISSTGELYTWGRDEGEGRLGHGPGGGADEGAEFFPIKVEALPTPVAAVACGGFSTMALTPEGQLWSWGGNSNFELGRGTRRDDWRPKPIPETENTCITQVACGGYHAAALTGTCFRNHVGPTPLSKFSRLPDDGKVLTWGHGGHGQLGHGSLQSGRVPCVVEALASQQVVSISCGSSWTAAVTESGELYTWGKNRDSQLGVPSLMDTQMTPILVSVKGNGERTEDAQSSFPHVMCVSAGSTHGMSLVYKRPRI